MSWISEREKKKNKLYGYLVYLHIYKYPYNYLCIYAVTHEEIQSHRQKYIQMFPENDRKIMQLDGLFILATLRFCITASIAIILLYFGIYHIGITGFSVL